MNLHWLMRMSHLVRNPPSRRRFLMLLIVLCLALLIVALERVGIWPEALTADKIRL